MLTDEQRAQLESDLAEMTNGASAQEAADERQRQHLEDELRRVAALTQVEYERQRKSIAKQLGLRITALDKLVAERRVGGSNGAAKGRPLDLYNPEPWPDPVNGAELLDALATRFQCHVILPAGAAIAAALWTLLPYVLDCFDVAPRLAVTSPTMRSGKTTLLSILNCLVPRALLASNISPASIFRVIESAHPCLLIDEADTFARENEELRGILNSGHTRDAAFVVRVEGDDHEPRRFSTWGAMAVAGIGRLPPTWIDRSVIIALKRKTRAEKVERLTRERKAALEPLARMAARWAADCAHVLEDADPKMPDFSSDRATDNWRVLIAIADAAGGAWPERARKAAIDLNAARETDDEGLGVQLLADLRDLFDEEHDRSASAEIVAALVARDDRPWSELGKAHKPLTKAGLARLLRPFLIFPRTIRLPDNKTPKGYILDDMKDAFLRYLPNTPLSDRHTATTQGPVGETDDLKTPQPDPCGGSENARSSHAERACGVVADENASDAPEKHCVREPGEEG
jgi:putative DNA primase/helicase